MSWRWDKISSVQAERATEGAVAIVLQVKIYPPHLAISTAAELHEGFEAAIWVLNLLGTPYVESKIFPPLYNRPRFWYAAVLSQVCFFTDKVLNLTNSTS